MSRGSGRRWIGGAIEEFHSARFCLLLRESAGEIGFMQGEFNFGESAQGLDPAEAIPEGSEAGYLRWRREREEAIRELRKKLGIPLGYPCEVWLKGGVRLKGLLRLREETLLLDGESLRSAPLEVDGVPFLRREIESCVRAD